MERAVPRPGLRRQGELRPRGPRYRGAGGRKGRASAVCPSPLLGGRDDDTVPRCRGRGDRGERRPTGPGTGRGHARQARGDRESPATRRRCERGPRSRVPRIVARSPAMISGPVSVGQRGGSRRRRDQATAVSAEWRAASARRSPDSAIGWQARIARRATSGGGPRRLRAGRPAIRSREASRSMWRWPRGFERGARNPEGSPIVLTTAAIAPTTVGHQHQAKCFCGPTAASTPSWRGALRHHREARRGDNEASEKDRNGVPPPSATSFPRMPLSGERPADWLRHPVCEGAEPSSPR
jgi:hypothetical protein